MHRDLLILKVRCIGFLTERRSHGNLCIMEGAVFHLEA